MLASPPLVLDRIGSAIEIKNALLVTTKIATVRTKIKITPDTSASRNKRNRFLP